MGHAAIFRCYTHHTHVWVACGTAHAYASTFTRRGQYRCQNRPHTQPGLPNQAIGGVFEWAETAFAPLYSPYKSLRTLPGCHDSMYDAKEYQHCKIVDPKLTAGGRANANPGVECIHCQSEFTGGPFRIRGHILSIRNRGGGACTADDTAAQDARAYFQQVEDDMAANKQKKRKREELDELTNGSGTGGSTNGLVQLTMEEAIAPCLRDKADQSVARFVIAEGVPFVKIESVYFQDMLTAVGAVGSGYRPPSVKRLRTTLLDKELEYVKERLKVRGQQCHELLPHSK